MNQELIEIREQQKQTWNKFSGGWKKWDDLTMEFLKPMGDVIIESLQPAGDQKILDVAAGTGEPGLTIATMLQGGKVTITDLAEDMLAIAKENSVKRGIENIETLACDVCEMPFPDQSFDSISCRMGFMFFPDMQRAADEMYRVLQPGGKMATSVWNVPDKNFWVTATMGTIMQEMELPPPPPGSPGMFRCAKPGLMKEILEKAGFKNITEQEVPTHLNTGTVDAYWILMNEVAAPVVAALSKADEATYAKIKQLVFEKVSDRYKDPVSIEGSALVFSAEK